MKKPPLVSVIITNWNGGELYKKCIKSLSEIDYPKWELVVVDDASTDDSFKTPLPKSSKLIINKKNVNFARANNIGYGYAKGKYILLLNNDTLVPRDFLTNMTERMEADSNIGVLQPKIRLMDSPGYLDNAGSFMTRIGFLHHWGFGRKDSEEFDKEKEIFSAKGACMLIRNEIIKKSGLFDEDYISYFEETDFCWRILLMGYKVLYYPGTEILHKVGFTTKRINVLQINYNSYKNRIATLIKNLGFFNLTFILPAHLVVSCGIAAAFALKGQFNNSFMIIRAIWWNIVNLQKTLSKRSKVQALRKVSDGEIFRSLMAPVDWKGFFGDFKRIEKDLRLSLNQKR
ncbi:MAG: putative glycosyltransferase [Candidatus Woesebacteria bacterium GW2011_GWB1_45_5]|uniref:Putative glycosyltransferase n=1 Tax=Candidatus Woesebacteria bacterium GW2011_GWB1_45_5 TaxID=1618581 RepID=A0A0G1MRF9_9BACT|nr:MAG: putative glycosyltransferase [Candidatus Woesebacteria bacterium GW2011_GWB1_45_5]